MQPGLLLDVDITSIKRKKATLDGMANVLNEFLHGVSKGFMDQAFPSFSRRRSTVRADIAQTFGSGEEDEPAAVTPSGRAQFIDMLNETPSLEAPAAETVNAPAAPRSRRGAARTKKAGAVDNTASRGRRGRKSGVRTL